MDLNEPVFWDKNNKRLGRNSTILSSDLHQIWQLFTKLYSAVYFVKDSDTVRQQLSRIGNVLDNVILGMSSRQTCLKMFIDQGLMIKHPTILKWSNKSVQYVKMFTDDILCCLAYGRTWGIDETVIDIRGKWHSADARWLSEIRTMEQKHRDGGFLSDSEFKKE